MAANSSRKQHRPVASNAERRILDAAERLFAEFGYNGVSVRDITKAAGANLSSVYYHFHSKPDLLDAVCRRRMAPIVEQRLAEMRAAAGSGRADADALVAAFVASSIRRSLGRGARAKTFRQLVGHLGTDPTPEVRKVVGRIYDESVAEFVAALRALYPKAAAPALFWAVACTLGVTLYVQGDLARLRGLLKLPQQPANADDAIRQVTRYIAGGLTAATD